MCIRWILFGFIVLQSLQPLEASGESETVLGISWPSDPGYTLAEMEENLPPGAKCLLVATPQESEEVQILQWVLRDRLQGAPWSIEEYRQALWDLGFDIEHFEVARSIQIYSTAQELRDVARDWAKRLQLQDLSPNFPDLFAAYAWQHFYDPESRAVLIPSRTLIVSVFKPDR